jgi:hypothetical protein
MRCTTQTDDRGSKELLANPESELRQREGRHADVMDDRVNGEVKERR